MPMHLLANVGQDGDVALFFGLSGPARHAIATQPHSHRRRRAWLGPRRRVQFRGRLLRQCIKLSEEAEPEIYAATNRFARCSKT